MKKKIVYYHPRSIRDRPDRGSDLRVAKMLGALQQLDYEVIVIAGDARTRHIAIGKLKSDILAGLKIEYVYGESSNAPIIFADKRLIPSNPFIDYAFFFWLKKRSIPLGIFYRDVYWRFDFFDKQLAWPFNILLRPLYHLDWYMYDKFSTVLFLPSETMNQHLPRQRKQKTLQPLPPGFDASVAPRPLYDVSSASTLKLLYVGGIEPTVYDISQLLGIVAGRKDLQLTICCRSQEWEKYGHLYEKYMSDNIRLAHVSSDQLTCYYHEADVFLMLMGFSAYMDFAMPVKFSEAIGYALPIVSLNQKEVANYIRTTDIGWVLNEFSELPELLTEIASNRQMLSQKHRNLLSHRPNCSWKARAEYVDRCLSKDKCRLNDA